MANAQVSGPPPISESSSCHQCSKSFNIITRRAHACGHCGYEYCSACLADGQALMPRNAGVSLGPGAGGSGSGGGGQGGGGGGGGPFSFLADIREGLGLDDRPSAGGGYEVEKVCTRCLGMLQVTSAPVERLRTLPLKRLKEYLGAYNIQLLGPTEKEDFVQGVIKARDPRTGCLSPEAEAFYRRHSVPSGTSVRTPNPHVPPRARPPPHAPASASASASPRPPPSAQARPPPIPRPAQSQAHYHSPHAHRPPPPASAFRARPPPPQSYTRPPPPPAAAAPPRQPSPPVPTILSLVSLPRSYLGSLSIGTLKAILFDNHVRVDFKQVLEKEELVSRVFELVSAERRRLERQRYEEEREARELAAAQNPPPSVSPSRPSMDGQVGEAASAGDEIGDSAEAVPAVGVHGAAQGMTAPTGPMPEIERGLCVVCQDEEATLAVVDCGHLCMCNRE